MLTPHFLLVTAAALSVFVGFGATIPLLPRFIEQEFGDGDTAIGIVFGSISITAIVVSSVRAVAPRNRSTASKRWATSEAGVSGPIAAASTRPSASRWPTR